MRGKENHQGDLLSNAIYDALITPLPVVGYKPVNYKGLVYRYGHAHRALMNIQPNIHLIFN